MEPGASAAGPRGCGDQSAAGGGRLTRARTAGRAARSPGFQARRLALLALFEAEFRPGAAIVAAERLGTERRLSPAVRDHARRILDGVERRRDELDRRIAELAPAIPVAELGRVERSILRSAIFEVLYSAATPSGDAISDAVALARIYAGDAARRLVNGVLGSLSRSSGGGD